jgi:ABC-type phosphate/phosphonate transport system substrate-binding protein
MKKTISSLFIMGGLISVAALAGCGGSSDDSTDIFVQLVPSNNATTLLSNATKLEPYLNKYVDSKFTFHVSVGTSYGASTPRSKMAKSMRLLNRFGLCSGID